MHPGKMQRAGCQAQLLLLLLASLVGAFPHDTLRKSCGLSKYRFLLPSELKAVQNLKEQFEKTMLSSDRKCNTRVFHRKWSTAKLSVPDRMILVEAELDLVTAVLGRLEAPGLAEAHLQPLALLTQAQEDLRGCMSIEAPTHQPSGKLRHWLHKLEMAKQMETAGCLEASAILHLFQVLNDLKCVALGEHCA
ncbi:interferon lambda-3-like [Rhea pennata]|uniref:interferon lambda-3-like n=1 Tax=Rhea pennata TaxID=8795 RepID=UPI002E272BE6